MTFPQPEIHVRVAHLYRVFSREGNHVRGHVHADDLARFADLLSGQKTVEATPAPEIKNSFAFLQGGDGDGVSAAQPHVGRGRRAGKVAFVIAQKGGRLLWAAAAAPAAAAG